MHAARTGELTEVADSRTDPRWPDYLPRAVGAGNLSSLSVPLAIDEDEQVSGALNVYARQPDAFGGLADLRRRAAWHGGTLTVRPGAVDGTRLAWTVPHHTASPGPR